MRDRDNRLVYDFFEMVHETNTAVYVLYIGNTWRSFLAEEHCALGTFHKCLRRKSRINDLLLGRRVSAIDKESQFRLYLLIYSGDMNVGSLVGLSPDPDNWGFKHSGPELAHHSVGQSNWSIRTFQDVDNH
jgi:hypothetical protein